MKVRLPRFALVILATGAVAAACTAQAPGGAPPADQPAAAPPAYESPVVSDRTITVRYYAPNATQVTVNGELDGQAHPMTKGPDGVWSASIGPLAPDIYTYSFTADGVVALDPKNTNTKLGFGMFGPVSVVQVAGDGAAFYDAKPVAHGEVRIRPYESKALGVSRTVWIYTPPGYDRGGNFPVLYLLHGGGDVESGWTLIGRANLILDNLIAEGRAKPMVLVMPLGHAMQSFWTGPAKVLPNSIMSAMAGRPLDEIIAAMMSGDGKGGLSEFSRDVLEDVMPLVERNYKVSTRADDRAIAGLSMGGGQTINIAFNRPELFRYVLLMSAAANEKIDEPYAKVLSDPGRLNTQFKLLWVGVGKDDMLTGPGDKRFSDALKAKGIKHEFVLTDGRHEWTVWRHHLRDTATRLFK